MKTIRWGMIGCGDVTEIKSGPGFYKAEHSQLAARTAWVLDEILKEFRKRSATGRAASSVAHAV